MAETQPAGTKIWRTSEDTRHGEDVADQRARAAAEYDRVGWVSFTATVMALVGAFQIIDGLTALFRSGTYLVGTDRLAVNVDYTVWGWVHLILGVIAVATAWGLTRANRLARFVGVAIASVSALANLVFIPANPFLAIMVIVLDILVIYGIVVYGHQIENGRGY